MKLRLHYYVLTISIYTANNVRRPIQIEKETAMFDQDLKESLMQAIKFTPEDLEANRNGTVTETQRARLGKIAGFSRGATIVGFGLFIIIIIAIGVYFF